VVGSRFRGDGEVREKAEVAVSPRRVLGRYRSVGANTCRTSEFLDVEGVPEGIREGFTRERELSSKQTCFVIVVSDEKRNASWRSLGVVRKNDGVVHCRSKATQNI
jgi:hypothetical protein